MEHKLKLHLLDEKFALSKMPQFAEVPSVMTKGELCFVARTDEELSIFCPEFMAPTNVQQVAGYRCFRIADGTSTDEIGVIVSLVKPLADAKISIFSVSTFSTTYIFLMEEDLVKATQALQQAGHEFIHED